MMVMGISPGRDLNNFIKDSFYSYPFFGDYICRQCHKIVINKLFEGNLLLGIGSTLLSMEGKMKKTTALNKFLNLLLKITKSFTFAGFFQRFISFLVAASYMIQPQSFFKLPSNFT
jgi:hypothetical protein